VKPTTRRGFLLSSGTALAALTAAGPGSALSCFPNSEYSFWTGIVAPARTPVDIKAKLHAEVSRALAHPPVRDQLRALTRYAGLAQREFEINTQLVKAARIKVN
jgi:hypothetical protein